MTREGRLVEAFVTLADTLVVGYDLVDLLHTLVTQCVPLFDASAAGIILTDDEEFEVVASTNERSRLVEIPSMSVKSRLGWDDFKGALGVFLLVVASTFPLVVPFVLLDETALAVRLSNLVGIVVLFIAGWILARYAGAKPWQGGIAMAVTGAVLIVAIVALGG